MNFSDLIDQKQAAIDAEIASKQAARNDLDAVKRLYQQGILTDAGVREWLLKDEGSALPTNRDTIKNEGSFIQALQAEKKPTFVSMIWEAIRAASDDFTATDILESLEQAHPSVQFKKNTVSAYLMTFAKDSQLTKIPSDFPGGPNSYRLPDAELDLLNGKHSHASANG